MDENENAEIIDGHLKRLGYVYERRSTVDGDVVFTYRAAVPASRANNYCSGEYPVELVVSATDGSVTAISWADLNALPICWQVAPEVVKRIINGVSIPEQTGANEGEELFTCEGSVLKCVQKVPTMLLRQEFGTFAGRGAAMIDTLLRRSNCLGWIERQLDKH